MIRLPKFLLPFLLGIVICPSVQGKDFHLLPFAPGLTAIIESYHVTPQPQKAIDYLWTLDLAKFEKQAEESQQPHARAVLIAFYSTVLHQNPKLVLPFAKKIVKSAFGERAALGAEIIAYSGAPSRIEALKLIGIKFSLSKEDVAKYEALPSYPYATMHPTDQYLLDIIWACFFGSDDMKFLERISELLAPISDTLEKTTERMKAIADKKPTPDSPEHKEILGLANGEAVRFALAELVKRDSKILSAVQKLAKTKKGSVAAQLKAIITSSGKTLSRINHPKVAKG